jgi:hypothetical protein
VRDRHNLATLWHIAHVRTPRTAEYARCFDPIIAAPGRHAVTDHDRLVCDSYAHDLDMFEFLRLRSARFEDGIRAAAR